ncbi:hypothetical protein AGMMS50262_03640 [Bacteroidia bacterium]|nr:hypothetical protein AGMMS50262_03640 [Bacteroidia bacterium]
MRTIRLLALVFFFGIFVFPTFAADFHWTGATSTEFQTAGNWINDSGLGGYPQQGDNVFFDRNDAINRNITSGTISVNNITCTATVAYTLNATMSVYGDILNTSEKLTFTGNKTITMLGATQNTLALGDNVTHAIILAINKPGGGITATNNIRLNTTDSEAGLRIFEGDFSINGKDITVGTVLFGSGASIPTVARTINLTNCTITSNYNGSSGNGYYATTQFRGTNTTFNISNSNLIVSNPYMTISADIPFQSLTLNSNTLGRSNITLTGTVTAGTLNINTPEVNAGAGTYAIGTLNINQQTTIVSNNGTMTFNAINDPVASCSNAFSVILNATLQATVGTAIETHHINYSGCTFSASGNGFIADENNNMGNSGTNVTWNPVAGIDYYWISGKGSWNDPVMWAINPARDQSNGCVPTAVDVVHFDPALTDTVTIPIASACREMDWPGAAKGGVLTGSQLSIWGNADFSGADQIASDLYFVNNKSASNSFTLNSGPDPVYTGAVTFRHLGTYTFTSDFLSSGALIMQTGTVTASGLNIGLSYLQCTSTSTYLLNISNSIVTSRYTVTNANFINNIYLTNPAKVNISGTEFHIYPATNGGRIDLFTQGGIYNFHNVTFHEYPNSTIISTAYLRMANYANKFDNFTFDNVNGNLTGSYSFSVGNLTLSPFRTYTLGNNYSYTITGSLNAGSGACSVITLISGTAATHRSTIINKTGGVLTIPGGNLTRINYTRDTTDNSMLQVPNGVDGGSNDMTDIYFTTGQSERFYWVGDAGDWSDPTHWSLGVDDGVFPSQNNANGCIPNLADTVYFTGNSFTQTGQTVVMDQPATFNTMIWTAEAGINAPLLNVNAITASGSIMLASGMTVGLQATGNISFTGSSDAADAQTFDTRGVTYAGGFRWGTPAFSTGRYDWYGNFPFDSFAFTVAGSFYASGATMDVVNPSGQITQATGKTVDISNATFTGRWDGPIIINQCANFNGEGAVFNTRASMTITNNDGSCTEHFGSFITSGANTSITNTGTGVVCFDDKIIFNSTTVAQTNTITGLFETDTLEVKSQRGTLALGAANTVIVHNALIQNGSPCDEYYIKSTVAGIPANLKLPACDLVSYDLYLKDINILLPDDCEDEDVWTVYGTDQGDNSSNIQFEARYQSGIPTLFPPLVASCKPYIITLPGNAASINSIAWKKDNVPLTANANQQSLSVSEPGFYEATVVFNSTSSTGCNSPFSIPISFSTDFEWTGAAGDNDWNNTANWDQASLPDACSYVTIPGGLSSYPVLEEAIPEVIPAAACDTIDIKFGGEVKNTHYLTYNGAKVELDINSNQWYMLSAPLRNTYSGDYYVTDHNPHADLNNRGMLVHMMRFDITNPQTGYFLAHDWTNGFNTNDIELQAGQGFALFANPKNSDYGEQNEIGEPFCFPKADPVHYYYNIQGAITGVGGSLDRTNSSRFIYEDAIDGNGIVTLSHSSLEIGEMVLVGNPFMAHLDFDAFSTNPHNTGLIYDEYKIASDVIDNLGSMGDFVTYKNVAGTPFTSDPSTLPQYIAPMQSFIVYAKGNSGQLIADIAAHTAVAPAAAGSPLLSPAHNDTQQLFVTAIRGKQKSSASLVRIAGASKNYHADEDSRKLFDEKATEPVLVYLLSSDGIALDINTLDRLDENTIVKIGIRTSKIGRILFTFTGMEDFDGKKIYLHDAVDNTKIDLSEQSEYAYIKYDSNFYTDDRFYLSFEDITGIKDFNGLKDFQVTSPVPQTIRITSNSGNSLGNLEIIDTQGRTLVKENTVKPAYSYQANATGVYIVRVNGETKKIIVK